MSDLARGVDGPRRVRTLAAVAVFGFSSGLPIALSQSTLEAWCAVSGLSLKTIGLVKLVGAAYVFKVIWAPLLDRVSLPWLGRRRGWALAMQIAIGAILIAMAGLSPETSLAGIATLAVLLAIASATQDIAIDAYRADQLAPEDRGLGAALGVGAYRVAMIASGGVALVLAASFGWRFAYLAMAALMGIGVIGSLFAPERALVREPRAQRWYEAYAAGFREFLTRPRAPLWLALIVLYKFGSAFALTFVSTFLLRGAGYSLAEVGWVNKIFALSAVLIGVFIGGLVLERWSLWRGLIVFGVLQLLGTLGFLAISLGWTGTPALIVAVAGEYLMTGLATAAFAAMLMALCSVRFSATQYALFSSLDAIPRTFLGPLAGAIAEQFGWSGYWIAAMLTALPGLALLFVLRPAFADLDVRSARIPRAA